MKFTISRRRPLAPPLHYSIRHSRSRPRRPRRRPAPPLPHRRHRWPPPTPSASPLCCTLRQPAPARSIQADISVYEQIWLAWPETCGRQTRVRRGVYRQIYLSMSSACSGRAWRGCGGRREREAGRPSGAERAHGHGRSSSLAAPASTATAPESRAMYISMCRYRHRTGEVRRSLGGSPVYMQI